METKRRYEHPTPAAGATPAAVSPERALRVFTQPERNPGIPLDLDLVRALRINRSAVERRAATIPTRRTVKKEWQRSEEHTSELQSLRHLVCRLLLETKNRY